MKRISLIICLLLLVGCGQSNKSSEEVLTQFLNDYINIEYEVNKTSQDIYPEYVNKLETYFTEEAFLYCTGNNWIQFPLEVAYNHQSNLSIQSLGIQTLFEENETIGYYLTLKLALGESIIEQVMILSFEKQEDDFKIYAFEIPQVNELLLQIK